MFTLSSTQYTWSIDRTVKESISKKNFNDDSKNKDEGSVLSNLNGMWLKEEENSILVLKSDKTYQAVHIYEHDETALIEEGKFSLKQSVIVMTPNQRTCNGSPTPHMRIAYSLKNDSKTLVFHFIQDEIDYPITFNKVGEKEVKAFKKVLANKEITVCI